MNHKKLIEFYKAQNHESKVKSKLDIAGYDNTAIEFEELPGIWFLLSRDGMKLYVIQPNIQRLI